MTGTTRRRRWSLAKKSPIVGVALAAALLLAACSSSSSGGSGGDSSSAGGGATTSGSSGGKATGSTVKVGFIAPLSGSLAFIGDGYLPVFQASINAINAQGGVDGHPLQVVSNDDTGTSTGAITALRTLSSKGISVVWGSPVSGNLQAEIPLAKQLNMVLIGPGYTTSMVKPPQKNVYGGEILGVDEADTQLKFAQDTLATKTVGTIGLLVNNTPASVEWANAVNKVQSKYGAKNVDTEYLTTAAEATTEQVRKVANEHPNAVLMQLPDGNLSNVVTELRQDGYSGIIVNYHGGGGTSIMQSLNDPKLYVARTVAEPTDKAQAGTALATFEKYIASTSGASKGIGSFGAAPEAYTGGLIIQAGLTACGIPCKGSTLADKMNTMTIDTKGVSFGPISYTTQSHQGVYDEAFYHYVGGTMTRSGGIYRGGGTA
jgi:branched-chain amino acid transport system substrate-binding protein